METVRFCSKKEAEAIKRRSRILALVLMLAFLLPGGGSGVLAETDNSVPGASDPSGLAGFRYDAVLAGWSGLPQPETEASADLSKTDGMTAGASLAQDYEGRSPAVLLEEGSEAVFWLEVGTTGLYGIEIGYMPLPGRGRSVEISLEIDGELPFSEAGKLLLHRNWIDETEVLRDNRGNDIRPNLVERRVWKTVDMTDSDGLYNEPFLFRLEAGIRRITIRTIREGVAVSGLFARNRPPAPNRAAYLASLAGQPEGPARYLQVLSAETARAKTHPVLYPIHDRTTPATECRGEPNHPSKIRLNAIGGTNWRYVGQAIEWAFSVPEDGFYGLAFRARQNFVRGMVSTRRMTLDGSVPYQEIRDVRFPYSIDWENTVVSDDQGPARIFLSKGDHVLRLEVVPGDMAEVIRSLEQVVFDLNFLYRKIIMITGTIPDIYRDYYLENKIPGLLEGFGDSAAELRLQAVRIREMTGTEGSEAALLDDVARQLESLVRNPETIPERLDRYKGNVSALAAWLFRIREQPLELDTILVLGRDTRPPPAGASFFRKLWFDLQAFALSFVEDYNAVGNTYESGQVVTVWVSKNDLLTSGSSSGQDQAQVIKRLIDNDFVRNTGIGVNMSLVDNSQTLTQAVLGGQGPDVALLVPEGMPVNLAVRGALAELGGKAGFADVETRFKPSAFISYRLGDGVYALPETQNFNMMFYRKDILDELGVSPPDTWDAFYEILPVLQKNNMEIGIGENQMVFESLLYQKGGQFYADDLRTTGFDTPEALEAFKDWTGLYTKHGLPLAFDFYNRFRTGEMPLGISGYTFYNFLTVAAPELRGLWGMAPIPATVRPDGTRSRTATCYGSACILIAGSDVEDAAWEFMKWWTSADTQAAYGLELEYLIGPAARYDTANLEAFDRLPWSDEEQAILRTQWDEVWDVPQLPGNYITSRNLQYAFRRVVYYWENERETLYEYNKDINKEIARKRVEFGLD